MTFGYVDEVIFPFELNLKSLHDQDSDITTEFLVCDDICVPEQATLEARYEKWDYQYRRGA